MAQLKTRTLVGGDPGPRQDESAREWDVPYPMSPQGDFENIFQAVSYPHHIAFFGSRLYK